jgi:hypothetical protein
MQFNNPLSSINSISTDNIIPVRVKDIILDKNHPEVTSGKFKPIDGIGVIKYVNLTQSINVEDTKTLPYAFPINSFNTTLPLINEVVLLVKGPRESEELSQYDYYISILGIYNDINYLPLEKESEPQDDDAPGYEYEENSKTRPLYPFNGDTIIQGRLGNSIRFGGAKSPMNTLTNNSNKQKPITILTNGHEELEVTELYVEDINKDDSSIYLTSQHTIPLKQSKVKFAGAKTRPILSDAYEGKQIILNSGRLFFNSTEEDIIFTATNSLGISSKQTFIDSEDYIGLDAKKIYLGEQAKRTEQQPVIKGEALELFLKSLLDTMIDIGKGLTKAKNGGGPIPDINLIGPSVVIAMQKLDQQINPNGASLLKSRKVYTE